MAVGVWRRRGGCLHRHRRGHQVATGVPREPAAQSPAPDGREQARPVGSGRIATRAEDQGRELACEEGADEVISGKDDPKFVAVMVLIPVMVLALIVGLTDPNFTHVLLAWAVGLGTLSFWTFFAWSEWRGRR